MIGTFFGFSGSLTETRSIKPGRTTQQTNVSNLSKNLIRPCSKLTQKLFDVETKSSNRCADISITFCIS